MTTHRQIQRQTSPPILDQPRGRGRETKDTKNTKKGNLERAMMTVALVESKFWLMGIMPVLMGCPPGWRLSYDPIPPAHKKCMFPWWWGYSGIACPQPIPPHHRWQPSSGPTLKHYSANTTAEKSQIRVWKKRSYWLTSKKRKYKTNDNKVKQKRRHLFRSIMMQNALFDQRYLLWCSVVCLRAAFHTVGEGEAAYLDCIVYKNNASLHYINTRSTLPYTSMMHYTTTTTHASHYRVTLHKSWLPYTGGQCKLTV